MGISVFWFRRDLRLEDNTALQEALSSGLPVLPVFIFDDFILKHLPAEDPRVSFIYQTLQSVHQKLTSHGSSLLCLKGEPLDVWTQLIQKYPVGKVFWNKDYEPYARERDSNVTRLLEANHIQVCTYKDQVLFEEHEIVKSDGKPYTIFTPYKNRWLEKFRSRALPALGGINGSRLYQIAVVLPPLSEFGFKYSSLKVPDYDLSAINGYAAKRDFPAESTTLLGPHLRFGTVSIRKLIARLGADHEVFLGELIWREFFMQILFHFPQVVNHSFKPQYDGIVWRNNEKEFERWCQGQTGYPLVDAGMRQLNATGFMHNRVRMVVASFLCKHLLIDWRWGEAYFTEKLLDFELSSNNGNWQWAAGTGCDAAPYFRIFNPAEQLKKFDPALAYVKKWVPEFGQFTYPKPMVDHAFARTRALQVYKAGIAAKGI